MKKKKKKKKKKKNNKKKKKKKKYFFFFFNDTATTEIYTCRHTLSLHDALPIFLGACFTTLLILSAVLTAVFLIFGRQLLFLFGASDNTIQYSLDYMNIYVCGTVFVMMALGLNPFISAQGFAKISMMTTLIGAVVNIVLDPVLIFGFGMQVKGAALATIISQGVSAVWVLHFLTGKKTILRIRKRDMLV